jgi:hypothetical protein
MEMIMDLPTESIEEGKVPNKSKGTRKPSFLVTALQTIMLLGTASIVNTRQGFLEISRILYGADAPLMGSRLLDFVMHKETIFVVIVLAIATVAKEFIGPKWPLLINSFLLLVTIAINLWLIASLYSSI